MTEPAPDARSRRPPSRLAGLLFAGFLLAILVALFHRSLLGGRLLAQSDNLYLYPPWSASRPEGLRPQNPVLSDQTLVFLPWYRFEEECAKRGTLPLWNPSAYAGTPQLGSGQSSFFFPLRWIRAIGGDPNGAALYAVLRLFLAGLFAHAYLRTLRLSPLAASFGGLSWSLCGFLVVWLNHCQSNVALFAPLLLLLVERIAARPGPRPIAPLALVVGLQFLAGHFQTSLHLLLGVGLYALARAFVALGPEHPRLSARGLLSCALGLLLGTGLGAIQIAPFLDYLKDSAARRVFSEVEQVPVPPGASSIACLAAPDRFGNPAAGDYRGPEGPNLNYNELNGGWAGRLALLFSFGSLFLARRHRLIPIFGAFFLLAAAVVWRVPGFAYSLARAIPLLGSTKLMRLSLFVALSLSILGALGLDALLARLRSARARLAVGLGAIALAAVDLFSFAFGYNPEIEPAQNFPTTPAIEFLQRDRGLPRILAQPGVLPPNTHLAYGLASASGYDSVELERYRALVSLLSSDPNGRFFLKEIRYFDRPDSPLLDLLGVKYAILPEKQGLDPGRWRLAYDGEVAIYENLRAMPRAFVAKDVVVVRSPDVALGFLASPAFDPITVVLEGPTDWQEADMAGSEVEVTSYEPSRVRLRARMSARGFVVLADAYHDGWRVRVDGEGQKVWIADHALRAVLVPEGAHEIEFAYEPVLFRAGIWITGFSALGALLLLLRRGSAPAS
ncbi:MAG: YfhO family protein [Planctomycetes bacterium]|nr:YfhO family protein [Planctomycetota bacterium]